MYINSAQTAYARLVPDVGSDRRRTSESGSGAAPDPVRGVWQTIREQAGDRDSVTLTTGRIREIFEQIQRGGYNEPRVIRDLSERMLQLGTI